jgi:hypothetical protein
MPSANPHAVNERPPSGRTAAGLICDGRGVTGAMATPKAARPLTRRPFVSRLECWRTRQVYTNKSLRSQAARFRVVGLYEIRFLYGPRFPGRFNGIKSTISSTVQRCLAIPAAMAGVVLSVW